MMKQYHALRRDLPPGTFLLFRLGDFYEMFFDDAREASAILNVALTKRGEDARNPCGAVVLMKAQERHFDPKVRQKPPRVPCVLCNHEAHRPKHLNRPKRDVSEVPDRRCDDVQRVRERLRSTLIHEIHAAGTLRLRLAWQAEDRPRMWHHQA